VILPSGMAGILDAFYSVGRGKDDGVTIVMKRQRIRLFRLGTALLLLTGMLTLQACFFYGGDGGHWHHWNHGHYEEHR
jgi:hypothetical protein